MIGVGLILKGGSERRYSNSFISLFSSGFGHNSAEPHILMVMTFTGRDRVLSETPPEHCPSVHWLGESLQLHMRSCFVHTSHLNTLQV